jgi:hypothetical protein
MLWFSPIALAASPQAICNGDHGQVVPCDAATEKYWEQYNAQIPAYCSGLAAKMSPNMAVKMDPTAAAKEQTRLRNFMVRRCMRAQMHMIKGQ